MTRLRRALLVLFAFAIVMWSASCDGFFVSENSTQSLAVSPSAVILQAAADNVTPGDSTTLTATATTVGGTSNDVTASATWSSSDDTIATVSAGTVTVVGTTATPLNSPVTITATYEGKSSTAKVLTFLNSGPSSLTVNYPGDVDPNNLTPNQQFQLQVIASLNGVSTDIAQYVTYSTNASSSLATVSSTGLVTVQSGATSGSNFTVTATAYLANNTSISGTSITFKVI
jgi:hypothetical protein